MNNNEVGINQQQADERTNMRMNYVLIDYENVQPATLDALDKEHFQVLVFVGASQTKINFDTANSLQRLGSNARYIKIASNGPNALDFHIAFHIGQIAAADSSAYFHIISKDTGFDPLIIHLKTKKILVNRSANINDIPLVKTSTSHTLPERLKLVIDNLIQRGTSKPRTVKTLSSTIGSIFHKSLSEEEIAEILKELQDKNIITITENKVTYSLPEQNG